jgi:hypothetical protein
LQLFVNLLRRLTRLDPATTLMRSRKVSIIRNHEMRLLAGTLLRRLSQLQTPEPILIVDGFA